MKSFFIPIIFLFFILFPNCPLFSLSTEYMAEKAEVIVEGRILKQNEIEIDRQCFTESLIEVSAILKGKGDLKRILVRTFCKMKLKKNEVVYDENVFLLPKEGKGLFFLKTFKQEVKQNTPNNTFMAFGVVVYLYKSRYNYGLNISGDLNDSYKNVYRELFPIIESIANQKAIYIQDKLTKRKSMRNKVVIFSFILLIIGGVYISSITKR